MASVDREDGVRNIDTLAAVGVHSRWRDCGRDGGYTYTLGCTCSGARCKKKARERKGRKRRGRVSPSCSDRGRGTNAAPVSVFVSPAPSPPLGSGRFRAFRDTGEPPTSALLRVALEGVVVRGWAGPVQATPRSVARLPARRARQMFFVADYDAVCAIMTTSLPSFPLSYPFSLSLFRSFFRPAYLPPCRVHALCPLIPVLSLFFLFFFFSSSFPLSLSALPSPPRGWIHLPLAPTGLPGSFQDAKFALASARRTCTLAWPSFCLVEFLPASNCTRLRVTVPKRQQLIGVLRVFLDFFEEQAVVVGSRNLGQFGGMRTDVG